MGITKKYSHNYGRDWEKDTLLWDDVNRILLQEIRDELKTLNATFHCHRFQGIHNTLLRIDKRLSQSRKLGPGRPRKTTSTKS